MHKKKNKFYKFEEEKRTTQEILGELYDEIELLEEQSRPIPRRIWNKIAKIEKLLSEKE